MTALAEADRSAAGHRQLDDLRSRSMQLPIVRGPHGVGMGGRGGGSVRPVWRRDASGEGWILDELVAVAGYHRKHANRVLRRSEARAEGRGGTRGRRYDEGDREALIALWEASDRICSKRLKPR